MIKVKKSHVKMNGNASELCSEIEHAILTLKEALLDNNETDVLTIFNQNLGRMIQCTSKEEYLKLTIESMMGGKE